MLLCLPVPGAAGAHWRQPGVVVQLCLRLMRQRATTQMPDRHRRVDQGGPRDRGRQPHPLGPCHRGAVAAGQRTRRAALPALRQWPGVRLAGAAEVDRRFSAGYSAFGIQTALIDPGKPWQNGMLESFNGKLRDECLGMEWFLSRAQAKVVIEAWRKHFNEVRPHSSLGYLTPAEFAAKLQQTNAAPASATGRDAARHGGFAPRPVAAPSELGQSKDQETPVLPT